MDRAAARALVELCVDVREAREPAVVVLRNAPGTDFCSGVGFDPLALQPDPASALATVRGPVICAVSGECSGPGLEIALACDIRLCDASARFAMRDALEGRLPAWGGTQRLPRAVGASRANAMLLLGAEADAATALEWGLTHAVEADLDEAIDRWSGDLAAAGRWRWSSPRKRSTGAQSCRSLTVCVWKATSTTSSPPPTTAPRVSPPSSTSGRPTSQGVSRAKHQTQRRAMM